MGRATVICQCSKLWVIAENSRATAISRKLQIIAAVNQWPTAIATRQVIGNYSISERQGIIEVEGVESSASTSAIAKDSAVSNEHSAAGMGNTASRQTGIIAGETTVAYGDVTTEIVKAATRIAIIT